MASSSSSSRRPIVPEITCPLCSYTADDESIIQLHFEAVHDLDSSFSPPRPPPVPPKPNSHRWPPLAKSEPIPKPNPNRWPPLAAKSEPIPKPKPKAPTQVYGDDAYDPFKYQIPNNNSQEIVGAPVWRVDGPGAVDKTPAVPITPTPTVSDNVELEYVTCEWKNCGEPVSFLELEVHFAMHEEELEIMDSDSESDGDDSDGGVRLTDSTLGQRERKGDALMDAAGKKRHIPKKEGPSNRQPKKMGQMERRLESELRAGEVLVTFLDEDDDDVIKVQKVYVEAEPKTPADEESKEYEFINSDEITEDDDEKDRGKGSPRYGSRHGKKLHKHNPSYPINGYGGYEISDSKRYHKKNTHSNGSSGASKPAEAAARIKAKFKKSELGPYANEKRMPDWLRDALQEGGKQVVTKTIGSDGNIYIKKSYENETSGLIPVIRQLSALDPSVKKAYVCHPSVKHVYKEHPSANGFCGYRNIQMLASYCQKNFVPGSERLYGERIPSIIDIQKWIEQAWDKGINAHAREETGGILYTRKYIGSSEVEAMFTSFGTSTIPRQFSEPNQQINALRHVWNYFSNGFEHEADKVVQTDKAPIYFQHQGHSMTIVGIEQYKCGTLCFLCFDPMFSPSQNIRKLVGEKRIRSNIAYGKLLKSFRRGGQYLKRYNIFEMVELAPTFEPDSTLYE
ncbi:hypothetical protein TWF481_005356 [Arthrobotrys musiformis]|uniref:UFSP1/2/DUB catalytic domain-containing protein n=1 Tax=Arthrobotrys musiformis TaxID=47236 RepID=A0AAV9WDL4_9PEZI